MTPESQRIAIAEACGWKLVTDNPCYEPYWENPTGNMIAVSCGMRLPDYLNDLNAMHEAEKIFNHAQYCRYISGLVSLTVADNNSIFMATAAQRAEAFLRTIEKWTTNQNEV